PITPKAASTQRLPLSSRSPGLRFPLLNSATPVSTKPTATSAISGGWEKKAAKEPQPRIASPREASVPPTAVDATLGVGGLAAALARCLSYAIAGAGEMATLDAVQILTRRGSFHAACFRVLPSVSARTPRCSK